MAIIGIDLGTTNSLVSYWNKDHCELIPNAFKKYLTPSVVSIDEDGEILVGKIAKERLISHPECSTSEFKRLMGTKKIVSLNKKQFKPEELSALILKKLKSDAEDYLKTTVDEAVISVPAYFDDNQRNATKLAAKLAGIKVERLINEPSAAALAYKTIMGSDDQKYVLVDFGGGTLDITVVDVFDDVIEIVTVAGDNMLGGKDFNEGIVDYFFSENNLDPKQISPQDKAIIYKMAENAKIALSTNNIAMMVTSINGKECSASLDNNKLIDICSSVFSRLSYPIKKALRDSGMTMDDIDQIILSGGSSIMPTVRMYIEKLTGKKPLTNINPDTAISLGAGIFAGMKERNENLKDIILTDICPFSLGISIYDEGSKEDYMSSIIQRNSVLPTSRSDIFCSLRPNQPDVSLHIYQGESRTPERNLEIGVLLIPLPANAINREKFEVRFSYDINGILEIDVMIISTKTKYNKVILNKSYSISDGEVIERLKNMEKLKIHPKDKEENRFIIAWAERLFEETTEENRIAIDNHIKEFKSVLNLQNERKIISARERMTQILELFEQL